MLVKVVQRGILLREGENGNEEENEDEGEHGSEAESCEALLLENPNGTWELPGGKISGAESAHESLVREVHEETGLRVTAAEPVETALRRRKKKKNRGKFGVIYQCRFEGESVTLSDEHVDFAWMGREQVTGANLALVDEYRALRRVMATGAVDDGSRKDTSTAEESTAGDDLGEERSEVANGEGTTR